MKLLKGQTELVEKDGIKLGVKVIDTVMQATIATMSVTGGLDGSIKLSGYILCNCLDSIEVDGVSYSQDDLTTKADISDTKTRQTLLAMNRMVIGVAFPTADDEKK